MKHLPLVRRITKRIHQRLPPHVCYDDLYSAGVVGLLHALERFDPASKVLFKTYAQFRIRGAIYDELRGLDCAPPQLRQKGKAIEPTIQKLTAQYGRSPSETEVADRLNMNQVKYQGLLRRLENVEPPISLDSLTPPTRLFGLRWPPPTVPVDEDGFAYLPTRGAEDALVRLLQGEWEKQLSWALSQLPSRERQVMTLYYDDEITMKEIGVIFGVCESRISQIHASAIAQLRYSISCLYLSSCYTPPAPVTRGPKVKSPRPREEQTWNISRLVSQVEKLAAKLVALEVERKIALARAAQRLEAERDGLRSEWKTALDRASRPAVTIAELQEAKQVLLVTSEVLQMRRNAARDLASRQVNTIAELKAVKRARRDLAGGELA